MKHYSATLTTPDGPFTLIGTKDALVASAWTDSVELLSSRISDVPASTPSKMPQFTDVVEAYYAGDFAPILDVPVDVHGSDFTQHVWGYTTHY